MAMTMAARLLSQRRPELGNGGRRSLGHVVPGEAAEVVTPRPGLAFPAPVPLPGVAGVVVAVAVELDRQRRRFPAAVDPVAARFAVHGRVWQVVVSEQSA